MAFLFLLALFLAWPTAGLSIVAFIAIAITRSYLQARTRMHFANERRASRAVAAGNGRIPSWAGDRGEIEVFIKTIQAHASRKGVPQVFLWGVLRPLIEYAGAMENEGASFVEQQVAVADKLVELWENAPSDVKRAAITAPKRPSWVGDKAGQWDFSVAVLKTTRRHGVPDVFVGAMLNHPETRPYIDARLAEMEALGASLDTQASFF